MQSDYGIDVTLSVQDASALWSAAARIALAAPGMTMEDVIETLGPREDPSVVDCLQMLLQPERFAGCTLRSLTCTAADAAIAAPANGNGAANPAAPADPHPRAVSHDRFAAWRNTRIGDRLRPVLQPGSG